MAGGEYVFRFVYPPVDSDPDPRAVEIKQVVQVNGTEELRDFYKVWSSAGSIGILPELFHVVPTPKH